MTNLTTTIEDTSPVIIYSDGWQAGSSAVDTSVEKYSQSSYMRTSVAQATASFSFYGNGLQIFGAKRQNYSRYQISIDTTSYPIRDASTTASQGTFQTSLFTTLGLRLGYHTVRIANIDQAPLDLDFMTWQTPVGNDQDSISVVTAQDTESAFEYSPQWNTGVQNPGMFSGGSGHVTYTAGSTVKFNFKVKFRSAIQLYGPVGPNCAPYTVALDGGNALDYNPNKPFYRSQQLLFQAGNLDKGDHSITVQAGPGTNYSIYFAIDYAQVFTPSSWGTSGSGNLSTGQVVGIAVGSAIGSFLLGILLFFLISRFIPFKRKDKGDNVQTVERFNDLQTAVVSPFYDTQSTVVTPQSMKGNHSYLNTTQHHYSQLEPSTPGSSSVFPQHDLTPLALSPNRPPGAQTSPTRGPRVLDEKRRLVDSQVIEDSSETQTSVRTPTTPEIQVAPPPEYQKG